MPDSSRVDNMYLNMTKGSQRDDGEKKTLSKPDSKISREAKDTVRATIYLRKDQHKRLKLMAVEKEADISALVRMAVDEYFENYKN